MGESIENFSIGNVNDFSVFVIHKQILSSKGLAGGLDLFIIEWIRICVLETQ